MSLCELLATPFRNLIYNLSSKPLCPRCYSYQVMEIPAKDWFSTPTYQCEKCNWFGKYPKFMSLESYERMVRESTLKGRFLEELKHLTNEYPEYAEKIQALISDIEGLK